MIPSKYSQTKLVMKNSKIFRDRNPFPSKLNIMSDADRKARGLDKKNIERPIIGDIKYEK